MTFASCIIVFRWFMLKICAFPIFYTGRTVSVNVPLLGLLTNLKVLDGRKNELQGTMPSEIWQLTKLIHLGFSINPQLQGSLASEIGRFKDLRYLIMDESDFSGKL